MDELLTIKEVAQITKLSKSKLYYLAAQQAFPVVKIGRNIRVRKIDLEHWLGKQLVPSYSDVWYFPQV